MTVAKAVQAALDVRLREFGFSRRHAGVYTLETSDGFLGWLGLNKGRRGGTIEVNPVVGIRSQEIEGIVASLLCQRDDGCTPPTVSVSLGYLTPRAVYKAWLFEALSLNEQADDLIEHVRAHALPFFSANSSMTAMIDNLNSPKFADRNHSSYRLPIAALLAGSRECAADYGRTELAAIADRTDPAAKNYRNFVKALASSYDLHCYSNSLTS